jgi:hypothetical protein
MNALVFSSSTPLGIEPRISGFVDQRLIHWAMESLIGFTIFFLHTLILARLAEQPELLFEIEIMLYNFCITFIQF